MPFELKIEPDKREAMPSYSECAAANAVHVCPGVPRTMPGNTNRARHEILCDAEGRSLPLNATEL